MARVRADWHWFVVVVGAGSMVGTAWYVLAPDAAGRESALNYVWRLGPALGLLMLVVTLRALRGTPRVTWAWAALAALVATVVNAFVSPWARDAGITASLASLPVFIALLAAILWRGARAPGLTGERLVLTLDVMVSLTAGFLVLSHFLVHCSTSHPSGQMWAVALNPAMAVLVVIALQLMLRYPQDRALRGPRALAVGGYGAYVVGHVLWATSGMHGAWHIALVAVPLTALAFPALGIAAGWEREERAKLGDHAEVVDRFPSMLTSLLPIGLLLAATGVTLWGLFPSEEGAAPPESLTIGGLGVLVGLFALREIVAALSKRGLYAEMELLYADMARSAVTDPLTAMPNHRYFVRRLEAEWSRAHRYGRPLAVIFADLDYFKRINDTYGHAAGDKALVAAAASLQENVRDSDVVARYGGEEFVVLLPETGLEAARQLAERLRSAMERVALPVDEQTRQRVTISLGVAAYPETSGARDALLADADHAMYAAKAAGRNCVVVASGARKGKAGAGERQG